MGDSLKAAAEYYDEQHRASPEFAQNQTRVAEWNKLFEQAMKLRVAEFTVSEMIYLLKLKTKAERDWIYEGELDELRKKVGSIVDRIAQLDS